MSIGIEERKAFFQRDWHGIFAKFLANMNMDELKKQLSDVLGVANTRSIEFPMAEFLRTYGTFAIEDLARRAIEIEPPKMITDRFDGSIARIDTLIKSCEKLTKNDLRGTLLGLLSLGSLPMNRAIFPVLSMKLFLG